MSNESKKVKRGLSLLLFLASIAGIVISGGLIKEDIISTARTIYEFFPARYGVTPASTWSGALWLGGFTTVLQVVSAGVAFSKRFGLWYSPIRLLAFTALALSLPFDNWTDIVYRSGYLSGNMAVATATTIAFYTGGSEVTQYLSASIFFSTWRSAISDLIWAHSNVRAGLASIMPELERARRSAIEQEKKNRGLETPEKKHESKYKNPYSPASTYKGRPDATSAPGITSAPGVTGNIPRAASSRPLGGTSVYRPRSGGDNYRVR